MEQMKLSHFNGSYSNSDVQIKFNPVADIFFSEDKDKLYKVRGNWKLKNKIGWPLQPRTGRSVTILSDYKPILKGLKMFGDHCSKASVYAKMRLSLLKHL